MRVGIVGDGRAQAGFGPPETDLQSYESQFHVLDFDRLGIDQTSFAWQNLLGQSALESWTPTITTETNLDSVTVNDAYYVDLGLFVIGGGRFTADPTLTATSTSFDIGIPAGDAFTGAGTGFGVAFCGAIAGMGARIFAVADLAELRVQWVSSDVTSQVWSFLFMYVKEGE